MGNVRCDVETGTHSVVLHVLIRVQAVEDVTSERVEERVVVILHEQGPIVVGHSVGCSLSSVVKHAACNIIEFQRMKEHEITCKPTHQEESIRPSGTVHCHRPSRWRKAVPSLPPLSCYSLWFQRGQGASFHLQNGMHSVRR